jgi:hypothetical protein
VEKGEKREKSFSFVKFFPLILPVAPPPCREDVESRLLMNHEKCFCAMKSFREKFSSAIRKLIL